MFFVNKETLFIENVQYFGVKIMLETLEKVQRVKRSLTLNLELFDKPV